MLSPITELPPNSPLTLGETAELVTLLPPGATGLRFSPSTILRALSWMPPTPVSVSWLHYLVSLGEESIWYESWEREPVPTHFVVSYSGYVRYYVLAGGNLALPVVGTGLSHSLSELPQVPLDLLPSGRTSDWWLSRVEIAVLLGRPEVPSFTDRKLVRSLRVRYLLTSELDVGSSTVTALVSRLTSLVGSLFPGSRLGPVLERSLGPYTERVVAQLRLYGCDPEVVASLLSHSERWGWLAPRLLLYGERARIYLAPREVLRHLLRSDASLPLGTEAEIVAGLDIAMSDPVALETVAVKYNSSRLVTKLEIAHDPVSSRLSQLVDRHRHLLRLPPDDLLILPGGECRVLETRDAILPRPAPVLSLLELLTSADYHRALLERRSRL